MRRISILPSRLLAGLLLMSGPAAAVEPTQLELLGIFASSDEDRSTALLSVPGQAPLFARIGQPLPGGFSLQAITHDQVLVTRDGRRFRLVLQSRASGAAESPPVSAPAPSARIRRLCGRLQRHRELRPGATRRAAKPGYLCPVEPVLAAQAYRMPRIPTPSATARSIFSFTTLRLAKAGSAWLDYKD